MAYREAHCVEIREVIRRWQAGLRPGGPEPGEEQLARLATLSSTRPRQVAVPSEELLAPLTGPPLRDHRL